MKYVLTLILLGTLLASCSSAPNHESAASGTSAGAPRIASIATEGRFTEEAPGQGSTLPVMTVNSPPILLTPVQGNTNNLAPTPAALSTDTWRTYSNAALGVTVNYPTDWTVTEQTEGAMFTSPEGTTISLEATHASLNNNETRIGNQYCTSRTNSYNQAVDICVDNASFTYSAKFTIQQADGSTQGVMLITTTRTAGKNFEGMIDTLRPTK